MSKVSDFIAKLRGEVKAVEGSAFSKISLAEQKISDAKGRIIAIAAVHAEYDKAVAFIEAETAKVHKVADEIHSKLDSLLAKL